MLRAVVLLFGLLGLLPVAHAGYQGAGGCFGTLQEAATSFAVAWTGQCGNGSCRILSYTPVSGAAQIIIGGKLETYTIPACSSPPVALPSGQQPTPWYASDSGTVSACGSTVSGTGGVTGGTGGVLSFYTPTDEEKVAAFKDGAKAGGMIFAAMAVVYGFTLARRAL